MVMKRNEQSSLVENIASVFAESPRGTRRLGEQTPSPLRRLGFDKENLNCGEFAVIESQAGSQKTKPVWIPVNPNFSKHPIKNFTSPCLSGYDSESCPDAHRDTIQSMTGSHTLIGGRLGTGTFVAMIKSK